MRWQSPVTRPPPKDFMNDEEPKPMDPERKMKLRFIAVMVISKAVFLLSMLLILQKIYSDISG